MKQKSFRGFTLIELLVVIAIIGILATVVIGSVNAARTKGADAAIKSNIQGIRTEAEIYYDTNQLYANGPAVTSCPPAATTTSFFGSTNSINAINSIDKQLNGSASTARTGMDCYANVNGWSMSARLKSDATKFFCVDSSGKTNAAATAGAVAPTAPTATNPTTGCQ